MWQFILKRKVRRRWLLNIVTIILFLVAAISASFFVYQVVYAEKIYRGIKIGPYPTDGKTHLEAKKFLQDKTDEFLLKNFEFNTLGKRVNIEPSMISPSGPEFSYSLISFETENAVAEAFNTGRSGNVIKNILTTAGLIFKDKTIPLEFNLNEEILLGILEENFKPLENPPKDTALELTFKNSGKPYVKIIPERNGRIFNFGGAVEKAKENIKNLKQIPIRMALHGVIPEIKSSEINNALENLDKVLERMPVTLVYTTISFWGKEETQTWKIDRDEFASLLVFKKKDGRVVLGVDYEKLQEKMDAIAEQINIKHKNAKFVMENDRVIEFQISKEGQELNKEETMKKIEETVLDIGQCGQAACASNTEDETKDTQIELAVQETAPLVTTESVNTMGIQEVVGIGESNFAWSPTNRRHNIAVGSQKLHGLIIAPDEVFSLNAAIGAVNAATGFKPELVIKGNRTIPEYGGGLCQIATTMFRAALNAGVPILERQNHSYRVSYYEPPVGTDATIYKPHPDLKFKNNTGNSLLIQTNIEGDNLTYTLWGTDDGRKIEMGESVMWNITNPPPSKFIETLDLPPGQKKCTEHAHKGADVYFDYKVTYPDGEIEEKRFSSHYRPWQEVCLIGVKELSASSTPIMAE